MTKLQILCKIQHEIDLFKMLSDRNKRSPEYQGYQYNISMLSFVQKEIEENLVDKEEQ